MVSEGVLERGAERAAVERRLGFEVSGVGRVHSGEAGWSLWVEPMSVVAWDQMLHLGKGAHALPGEEHVNDVRTADPLEEAAVVELAPARLGGRRWYQG